MKVMFCCLRGCLDGLGFAPTVPHIPRENPIQLDTAYMGIFFKLLTYVIF